MQLSWATGCRPLYKTMAISKSLGIQSMRDTDYPQKEYVFFLLEKKTVPNFLQS